MMENAERKRKAPAKVPVFMQDVYSAEEVARLLGVAVRTVSDLSKLESNPLPMRMLPNRQRGMFILRNDFRDWIEDNCPTVAEASRKRPK